MDNDDARRPDGWMHMAVSVDADRFSDAYLKRTYCYPGAPFLRGKSYTVKEFRAECARLRAQGKEVFPPCDNTGPDGSCLGHKRSEHPDTG